MVERTPFEIRIRPLADQGKEDDLRNTSVAERVAMVWPLTLDAWTFAGEPVVEPRLPRHVVRLERGRR